MAFSSQTHNKAQRKRNKEEGIQFTKNIYLEWFKNMLLARRFEEKAGQLYGQQKIRGFCHLYIGQEACLAGAATALNKDDKWITAYRDHVHPVILGADPRKIMAELYGKETGISKGKGGSMHMFDKTHNFFGGHGIVGGQIPIGAGIAFAEKYKKTKNVCICFLGDGAVRQGSFHETLNMAMLWKLPVIFAIENNGYAMGTSTQRSSNNTELSTLASSYKMPTKSVDGMRVEEVHTATLVAAKRARSGKGPTLLELRTYRYKGHSMSDPAKYRSKQELEDYKNRDPIEKVRETLFKKKISSKKEVEKIEQEINASITACVAFAEDSNYPAPSEAMQGVYVQQDYPFVVD